MCGGGDLSDDVRCQARGSRDGGGVSRRQCLGRAGPLSVGDEGDRLGSAGRRFGGRGDLAALRERMAKLRGLAGDLEVGAGRAEAGDEQESAVGVQARPLEPPLERGLTGQVW